MEKEQKKPNLDIMIDIETLSTNKNNALVLSIGMEAFSLEDGICPFVEGEWYLNIFDSLMDGFDIDESTLKWWRSQTQEAKFLMRGDLARFEKSPRVAYEELHSKLMELSKQYDLTVWSKGPDFDLAIIESAWHMYGIVNNEEEMPYKFWKKRDVRTLIDIARCIDNEALTKREAVHSALGDCWIQIENVQEAFKVIAARRDRVGDCATAKAEDAKKQNSD